MAKQGKRRGLSTDLLQNDLNSLKISNPNRNDKVSSEENDKNTADNIFCLKCGSALNKDRKTCSGCGNPV